MQCEKTKRDGTQCRARALAGEKHCALHSDPGKAAQLGSRGGRRRTVYSPDGLKDFAAPKTAADLRDLLAQSIIEIRGGKLDPKLANSISYLGTGFLRALEISEIEPRIEALEREIEAAKQAAVNTEQNSRSNPSPYIALLAAANNGGQKQPREQPEQTNGNKNSTCTPGEIHITIGG